MNLAGSASCDACHSLVAPNAPLARTFPARRRVAGVGRHIWANTLSRSREIDRRSRPTFPTPRVCGVRESTSRLGAMNSFLSFRRVVANFGGERNEVRSCRGRCLSLTFGWVIMYACTLKADFNGDRVGEWGVRVEGSGFKFRSDLGVGC